MAQPVLQPTNIAIPNDLRDEIESVILNADEWLDAPNSQFGGKTPRELIGTPAEPILRDLIQNIKDGMFT